MWCLHAESQVCMYTARGPPRPSSCQGLSLNPPFNTFFGDIEWLAGEGVALVLLA